jgi:ribosomal protein S18 acetylase RimI-like enzyme
MSRVDRMSDGINTPDELADSKLTVITYREELRAAFEQLNRDWIERYFVLEQADRDVFSDPETSIRARGGEIFFVVDGTRALGTCAVLRHKADEYEIAKMAVASFARGRGLGDRLMEAAIGFARERGARKVAIVSNTILEPALRLYRKHGFVEVPLAADSRYQRANIRMELDLIGGEPAQPRTHPGGNSRAQGSTGPS